MHQTQIVQSPNGRNKYQENRRIIMSKVLEYLNDNKVGQFATIKDGEIVMRPFHFLCVKDGKFLFGTANDKEVYQQLKENPTAGFAVMGDNMQWLRLRGKVQFSEDLELKKEIFEMEPLLSKVYKTPDNPRFEVFYIYEGVASLHGGMGNTIDELKF